MALGHSIPPPERYEVLQAIGRGGMGEVFLAKDLRLERQVAIKYLRRDLSSEAWQHHLRHEAQLLAKLNHPNIVQIYDVLEQGESLALVMEYVDGRNLHIHLRERQVDYVELLRWLAEIATGLAAAHEAGIVHNDLKAENVLIGQDGVAKVTDFGIAQSDTDIDADILALGVLAASLLDGRAETTPALQDLLKQLQQKNASKRPSSYEAAQSFRRLWMDSTQHETPLPLDANAKGFRRNKAPVLVLIVFVIVAVSAGVTLRLLPPEQYNHVAVLPPVIKMPGELSDQQQLNIRSTVRQALQQSVMATPNLALVSVGEVASVEGSFAEIAQAVGADELISSSLDCGKSSCELTIERLAGDKLAVLKQRATSILVDSTLESYSIVQRQWRQLYLNSTAGSDASGLITEDAFKEYLKLYQASYVGGGVQRETLARLEILLGNANRFLPLYDLYAHSALDMYDESGDVAYLDKLELILTHAETWAGESILLRRSWFKLAIARRDYETAALDVEAMEGLGGDDVLISKLSGDLFSYMAEYEKAGHNYMKAVGLKPSRELYYSIGANYYEWGKPEDAIETLKISIDLYPNDIRALGAMGMILMESGRLDEAIVRFKQALAIQPHALHYNDLGLAYMLKGDYTGAKEQFTKAYSQGSRKPELILNLADAESLLGHKTAAGQLYNKLVAQESASDDPVALMFVSQSLAQMGLFEQAIAVLRRIEHNGVERPQLAFGAALVYTLSGQNIAAMVEIEQALNSNFGAVWFSLPWFDTLCAEPQFSNLLQQAGNVGRCANVNGYKFSAE
jgi:tetratricopeptide (TPR) repeat protein/tRNA A-37 threonylcarbamoyl transferase component Bud32